VEAVCDRVLIINQGQIIADATPAQLHAEFKGAQELDLLVKGGTVAAVQTALAGLNGADKVDASVGVDGAVAVRVVSPRQVDLREAIFRCCVDHGWVILEMRCTVVRLEDIFHTLTYQGGH